MSDFYYVEFDYDGLNDGNKRVYDAFVIFGIGVKKISRDMMRDVSFKNLKITSCEKYSSVLERMDTKRDEENGCLSKEFLEILDRQEIVSVNWEFQVVPWEIPPYWQWMADKNGEVY